MNQLKPFIVNYNVREKNNDAPAQDGAHGVMAKSAADAALALMFDLSSLPMIEAEIDTVEEVPAEQHFIVHKN